MDVSLSDYSGKVRKAFSVEDPKGTTSRAKFGIAGEHKDLDAKRGWWHGRGIHSSYANLNGRRDPGAVFPPARF